MLTVKFQHLEDYSLIILINTKVALLRLKLLKQNLLMKIRSWYLCTSSYWIITVYVEPRGRVKLQRFISLHEMTLRMCCYVKKIFMHIFACPWKSRWITGSCICLSATPKLDEKYKFISHQRIPYRQYHTETY